MNKNLDKFNKLIEALETLPTIGKKSAMRLAYHMITNDNYNALRLSHAIEDAVRSIKKCKKCGGISEDEICYICSDETRDNEILCIVESAKEIILLEENALFNGLYFVLDSINDKTLNKLIDIVKNEKIKEVIFALTPSISNDAIILFIEDKLNQYDIKFTKIAQGVPTGVSLENIDIISLKKAIKDRVKV